MRKMFKALMALTLVFALLCPGALAASYGAKVLSSSMTLYDADKEPVGSLKQNSSFKVTAISGSWAKISRNGDTYLAKLSDIIFNKHIKAVSTRDTSIKFVTRKSYNEGVYYKATLTANTPLYVCGVKGSTYLVMSGDGKALGYVSKSAISKA